MQKPATPTPALKVSGTLASSATPTDVQPATLGNINNTTFFIKTQNGSVFLLSNPFINTDPTGDGTTIRRNGSTPIIADNGALTANIEFATFGYGATGYAADVLQECLKSDVNIVETVAHMMSAVHFFGDVDVICDIGGQDIKVLFMENGDIKNFRLSNQCSAGNGMLLQAMAEAAVERFGRIDIAVANAGIRCRLMYQNAKTSAHTRPP